MNLFNIPVWQIIILVFINWYAVYQFKLLNWIWCVGFALVLTALENVWLNYV